MRYHISLNHDAQGMMHYDSPEAATFIRPVIYPTASSLLSVMAELTRRAEETVIVESDDLARRCGVGEEKLARAMTRLGEPQHSIVELETIDGDITFVSLNEWLNPPRASVRAQRFSPALLDEFNELLASIEGIVGLDRPR